MRESVELIINAIYATVLDLLIAFKLHLPLEHAIRNCNTKRISFYMCKQFFQL